MGRVTERAILHIDINSYFASLLQQENPALRGKPVITGKERGIAASMSIEAKALGVKIIGEEEFLTILK